MFDHSSSNTKIHVIPDAALAQEPRRVELPGGYSFWLRPSDVLRIKVRKERDMGFDTGVEVFFSDGKSHFILNAGQDVADSIAATLWPRQV